MTDLLDADEEVPPSSWSDERLVAWARQRRYDRYPVAHVQMMTIYREQPDVAVIDFQVRPATVTRQRIRDRESAARLASRT